MYFSQLSKNDKQIIFQCLKAISDGNFLEEDEFQTRLGIEKEVVQKIIDNFPEIGDSDETLVVNNCLNEVCNGLQFSETEWRKWFSVTPKEIAETYKNWAKLRGWSLKGIK